MIKTNKGLVIETLKPSKSFEFIIDPVHVLKAYQAAKISSENAKIINKYKNETYKFVNENNDIVQKLKAKGIGKRTISYIESMNLPEDKKVHFLIIFGIILMAAPSVGFCLPLLPMGQRIGTIAIWPFFAAPGLIFIAEGVVKRESLNKLIYKY